MKFRVTLKRRYVRTAVSARNGLYYEAAKCEEAVAQARQDYPDERLTVQDWSFGPDHGTVVLDEGVGVSCSEMIAIEEMVALLNRKDSLEANDHLTRDQIDQVEEHLRQALSGLIHAFQPVNQTAILLRQRRFAEENRHIRASA